MAITVLSNVILSNQVIAAGIRGKQMRRNERVQTQSGAEAINIVWTQTLRQYELGVVPLKREDWQEIEALHEVTEGGAYGFLLEDPKDSTATGSEGIVTGPSSSPGEYHMYKRYTEAVSGRTKDRRITRPKASSILVYVNDVLTSAQISDTDGTMHITGNPSASAVRWTGTFYVPVHFMDDSIDWEMVVSGPDQAARYLAGPSVVLEEIRE
jgi:uncharacterized protein (TIGR02217 family)